MLNVLGFRRMLIWNGLLTGACLAACGLFTAQTPLIVMLAVLFVAGFSRSTQFTGVQSLGYAEIPSAVMSRATSFSSMMQQLMQSFGVGLTALVVHLSTVLHGHGDVITAERRVVRLLRHRRCCRRCPSSSSICCRPPPARS